ncbi:SPOR domain-containing protein [Mucilaginibacter sp. HC2]|uniref:SPOR domain-containing protein n=1 Tax=Mucilaginibacter inviolabilis TaxID=2714892 RepID=UPI00140A5257|nr:SPOR domain-containing protein [Mucilaginibacter inviolabilis]NHA05418.1 SPOR domain-containing protein [Mucilaginibacter inviolabilis]
MKKAVFDHQATPAIIRYCLFFVLVIASTHTFAQQARGKVEVVRDPLVDTLIAKRYEMSSAAGVSSPIASYGYRVQIFSGSNRKDAYSAQARLQSQYPELRTYIIYNEPNFKVRAGDFRTRLEAQKLMQDLRASFSSLFIISEKINLPKTDTND